MIRAVIINLAWYAVIVLTAAMERALPVLRDYLDQIGFVQLYKFGATAGGYHTNPNVLGRRSTDLVAGLASCAGGDGSGLALATCLMVKAAVPHRVLTPFEHRVAERLVDAELLGASGGNLEMGAYQLISAQDLPLLIDSRINYPVALGAQSYRVYLGSDSLRLAFYVDTRGISLADRVLDLGTGSGLIGLGLAGSSEHVTLTDVSPEALELAHINRLLTRMTGRVTIRAERCEETLDRGERYRVVTFNPPFLPLPDGLHAPVYAAGLGPDGLGYCRLLLENLDRILLPDGTAYFVANLLGTEGGPRFADELRRRADESDLRIDVFIDSASRLSSGAPVFESLGAFLHAENPAISGRECQRRVEELQLQTLGATHSYFSVVVIRRARDTRPSMRVYSRDRGSPAAGLVAGSGS